MRGALRVVDAVEAGVLPDAIELVFEYLAATQEEAGRSVPADITQLPDILRAECEDVATVYRPPGVLAIAYRGGVPVGCVGLQARSRHTGEMKRLYVRPAHRSSGVGRVLMEYAHRHAAEHGFKRLVLDVMPSRTRVIDFYRRLGYTETAAYANESPDHPMVYLERPIA